MMSALFLLAFDQPAAPLSAATKNRCQTMMIESEAAENQAGQDAILGFLASFMAKPAAK
jgi:hypothetical protein